MVCILAILSYLIWEFRFYGVTEYVRSSNLRIRCHYCWRRRLGLRAALQLAQSVTNGGGIQSIPDPLAYSIRSGGITCAIASEDPNDDWRWHMYDTVKGPITLAIKTPLSICVALDQKPYSSLSIKGCPFLERIMDEFTKGHLVGKVKILATVDRQQEPAQRLIEQVTRCCTRYFRGT